MFGHVPTFLWAILTLSCTQDQFQNSVFRSLQYQQRRFKSDKEKGYHFSQGDLGVRSGEAVSQAAQSPTGRTGSVCLAVFCYHSEANAPSLSSSPRESVAPQIPQRHLLMNVPIVPGAEHLSLNTANKPN